MESGVYRSPLFAFIAHKLRHEVLVSLLLMHHMKPLVYVMRAAQYFHPEFIRCATLNT